MKKKQVIRLTESDLHRVIKESVNKVLNEIGDTDIGQAKLGALAARKAFRNGWGYGEFPSDIYKYARDQRIKHGSSGFAFSEGNDSQWWVEAPERFGFNDTNHEKNVENAKKAAKQRMLKRVYSSLPQSTLNKAIKESVKMVLKEADFTQIPYNADYVTRNNWWKQQLDSDFPNHGVKNSNDYESEYNRLNIEKSEQEKAKAKREREQARAEKQKAIQAQKQQKRELFEKAVGYTLHGDESFMTINQYSNLDSSGWGDDEWNEWSDGIMKLPIYLNPQSESGSQGGKVVAQIDGEGFSDSPYNKYEYGDADYIVEWGLTFGEDSASVAIAVTLDDEKNVVYCEIIYCDNDIVNKQYSDMLITKYINSQIRKNMKVVLDKEQKWGSYEF